MTERSRAPRVEDGSWEFFQSQKLWHFDKERSDADFRIIGRFEGDWREDLPKLNFAMPKTVDSSMPHRSAGSYYDLISDGNKADLQRYGYPQGLTYGESVDELAQGSGSFPAIFNAMKTNSLLDRAYLKVTRQWPGQVWPFHIDNYHALRSAPVEGAEWDDPMIRRLWVALEDWEWGQFIGIGNHVWERWRAGDILYFDWLVPHGTANAGKKPRMSLFITGVMTPGFREWVASGEVRTIIV